MICILWLILEIEFSTEVKDNDREVAVEFKYTNSF